jgi:cardiolipin synthase A/B
VFEIALGLVAAAIVLYPVLAAWARIQGDKERTRRRLARPRPEVPLDLARRVPPASYGPLRHVRPGQPLLRAKAARLLINGGQAFPDMLGAIAEATRSVRLETFALASDGTGERFGDALVSAVQRGARVRVVYDDIGSRGRVTRDFVEHLAERGVEIAVYHPLRLERPTWAWNRRDHRKILIVDDEISFTGGLGITDQYAPVEDGGLGWRDTHLRAEGAAVARAMAALFDAVWARSQARPGTGLREIPPPRPGSRREAPGPTAAPGTGPILMSVLANTEFWRRRAIRHAYRYAIDRAERYVLIENAYFIPDPGFRRALSLAASRGVLVAVVVARSGDVPIADLASRATFSELLAGGVRIFEWPGAMLHAKTAVIDDSWAIVGSYNLDHRSLFHNLEAVVTIPNRSFARDLKDATLDDILQSREITLAEHAARPAVQRWKESLCFGLRFWL